MKKMLISLAVVAVPALVGSGFFLFPKTSQTSRSTAREAMTSSIKDAQTSQTTTKKSQTKRAVAVKSSETSAVTLSRESSAASTTTANQTHPDRSATSQTKSVATSQALNSVNSTSSSATNLSVDQANDWVWQQLAATYQNTAITKNQMMFNQYRRGGLLYIEAYENHSQDVAHLAGRFRVNSQGQLERQAISQGDTWTVVASSVTN